MTDSRLSTPRKAHSSSSSSSACATLLRHGWVVLTAFLGALSTFVVYERLFARHDHLSQHPLLVVSIEKMNVDLHQHAPVGNAQPLMSDSHLLALGESEVTTGPVHEEQEDKSHTEADVLQKISDLQPQQQQLQQSAPEDALSNLKNQNRKRKNKRQKQLRKQQEREALQLKSSAPFAPNHKVYFLNQTQVTHKDSFSASWLQSKHDFLEMELKAVKICEDAAFKAWNTRKDKLRMPMDYFDFSVEHLSKWWKLLDYYEDDIVYQSVTTKLLTYIQNGAVDYPQPHHAPPLLHETVATIAFQPYHAPPRFAKQQLPRERAYNLTVVSLAATIESLRRAEMGRVLVVGSEDEHATYTQHAMDLLRQHVPTLHSSESSNKFGHLEWGFVKLTTEMAKTKLVARNMPKGALVGARESFVLADKPAEDRTAEEQLFLKQWFGNTPEQWKYLYLTEPDSILTTRPTSLAQIKDEIDYRGGIIAPFRLQPIPHESDLVGYKFPNRYLPNSDGFENVLELDHYDPQHDVCCDEHSGHDHRPGKSQFPECGHKKWFLCGFEQKVVTEDPHRRLRPYKLFRLAKGTGLTTIAGNLFARRCLPAQNAVCKPPYVTLSSQ